MTKPTISDEDVQAFATAVQMNPAGWREAYKAALADFLAGRVPSMFPGDIPYDEGFNACRDMVLQGRKE